MLPHPTHLAASLAAAVSARLPSGWLAQQSDPTIYRDLTWNPPVPPWMPRRWYWVALCVLVPLVVGLAIYLYRAQRRIASKPIIITLTTIRALLIVLMFLTLAGPGCMFVWSHPSNGTLWLMLDNSASMAQSDPQSTPAERLRWADALGYLPAEARASGFGRQAAELGVLREDLVALAGVTVAPVEDKDAGARVQTLAKDLRRWNDRLAAVADAVEKDPQGKGQPAVVQSLRTTVTDVAKGIDKIETRQKPEQAIGDVPWRDARDAAGKAADALREAAAKADEQTARDSRVQDALNKVARLSRAKLAETVLTAKADAKKDKGDKSTGPSGSFATVLPKQTVKVLAFGDQSQVIIPDRSDDGTARAVDTALSKPAAPATDIASALRAINDQITQAEPASVVIFSDGRENKPGDLADAARRLAARGVRVYAVALGSRQVAPDAAVEKMDAPDWVFKGDATKVSALLRLDGLGGRTVDVELHRTRVHEGKAEDVLIDTKPVTAASGKKSAGPDEDAAAGGSSDHQVVTFTEKPTQLPDPGLYDYKVVIKPVENEVVAENNTQTARVAVRDHKLAALMIEDQPRWEYRYVANYLGRDNRVKLQTVLLQAARIERVTPPAPAKASPENERTDAQILPETQEEWYKFDVIMLGDLAPELLPKKQQEMIAKAVADRGATLILMAGPLNMPANWGTNKTDYPLTDLFPVEQSAEWTPQVMQSHLRGGYHPAVAPEGNNHLLTQLDLSDEKNDSAWREIQTDKEQSWYWHSPFTQARAGAQVIWSIADTVPAAARAGTATPGASSTKDLQAYEAANKRALLATMNVGLGKVMYLAGDATWRLRQVNGKNLHERFWGQVIRWCIGNDLPAGGQFVKFGTDKPKYVDGESAIVTARVLDKHLVPLKGQKLKVIARPVDINGKPTDPKGQNKVEAEMTETPESPGQYRAALSDLPSGLVELKVTGGEVDALLADDPTANQKAITVEVQKGRNLEQRNINADRATLASVAQAGGGAMVEGCYADVLADHIPELNYNVTTAEQIGMFTDNSDRWTKFTHYAFLGLFVVLITAEWIIRKVGGLV